MLTNRADYEFARGFIAEHGLREKVGGILLSPAFSKNPSPLRTVENATLDPAGAGGVDDGGRDRREAFAADS